MNQEQQLKLQAYADGELPESELREVSAMLEQDPEARALLVELKNTRAALAGFEAEIKLPEGRDFYWSKIKREIQRLEKSEPAVAPVSTFSTWRRFLIPASTFAALVIAGLFVAHQFGQKKVFGAPETETAFADSGAFTYRDYAAGMTLVWLSYPAETDFAETKTANTLD